MHVLITGANRGIGWHLASRALALGWQISTTTREGGAPDGARDHRLDVTDHAALATLAASLGPLDVLINNAGIIGPEHQDPLDMDFGGFARTFEVNTLAPLAVAHAVLPCLRPGGRILSISSQMSSMGYAKSDRIAYRASKAALNKVMQGLATALVSRGIIVVLVDPGWVRTDMGGAQADLSPQDVADGILRLVGRLKLSETGRFWRHDGTERPF